MVKGKRKRIMGERQKGETSEKVEQKGKENVEDVSNGSMQEMQVRNIAF